MNKNTIFVVTLLSILTVYFCVSIPLFFTALDYYANNYGFPNHVVNDFYFPLFVGCLGSVIVSALFIVFIITFLVKRSNFLNFAKFSYEEYKTKKLENRERKKQERIKKAEAKLSKLKRLE